MDKIYVETDCTEEESLYTLDDKLLNLSEMDIPGFGSWFNIDKEACPVMENWTIIKICGPG